MKCILFSQVTVFLNNEVAIVLCDCDTWSCTLLGRT